MVSLKNDKAVPMGRTEEIRRTGWTRGKQKDFCQKEKATSEAGNLLPLIEIRIDQRPNDGKDFRDHVQGKDGGLLNQGGAASNHKLFAFLAHRSWAC